MVSPQEARQVDWKEFLRTWDEERKHILSLYPRELIDLPYCKGLRETSPYFEPATRGDIERAETRLGYPLPLDLSAFYEVSNGWRFTGIADLTLVEIGTLKLIPSQPVDYVRDVDEHFNPHVFPVQWKATALLLSNMSNTGFCIANRSATGHWEYACAEFGARSDRYGTFLEFMESMRFYCLHYLREALAYPGGG